MAIKSPPAHRRGGGGQKTPHAYARPLSRRQDHSYLRMDTMNYVSRVLLAEGALFAASDMCIIMSSAAPRVCVE